MSDLGSASRIADRLPELTEAGRVSLAEMVRDGPRRGELIFVLLSRLDYVSTGPRDAGRYVRFLDLLAPTLPELSASSSMFLRLAASPVPVLMNFAVRMIAELDDAGDTQHPHELVPALVSAAVSRHATTARTALRLIDAGLREASDPLRYSPVPGVVDEVLPGLRPALAHHDDEVQRAAAAILMGYAGWDTIRELLAEACGTMAPGPAAEVHVFLWPPAATLDDVVAEAREYVALGRVPQSVPWWKADALITAIAATEQGVEPPAVAPRPWEAPEPSFSNRAVIPIRDLDCLATELPGQGQFGVETVERFLDGLAALGCYRPYGFERRVRPLRDWLERDDAWPSWGEKLEGDLKHLVAIWLNPELPLPPPGPMNTPRDWMIERLREVATMLRDDAPARLLAMPTNSSGEIAPWVLADRAEQIGDVALSRPVDVATALARLVPASGASTAQRLDGAPGVLAAVVRRACGTNEDVRAAPPFVRDALTWLHSKPHDGPPFTFGVPPAVPAASGEYWPNGGVWLWPWDTRWMWDDPTQHAVALSRLTNADEPLPAVAIELLLQSITWFEDTLVTVIADGRLTGAEIATAAAALQAPLRYDLPDTIEALSRVGGHSVLHRSVMRRGLAATAHAWHDLPYHRAVSTLLDQWCDIDECDASDWPVPAAMAALRARIDLARGQSMIVC